jgi:hypothetical protein
LSLVKKKMEAIHDLIAKSEENWECMVMLKSSKPFHVNAAMSRMYYSIFLLVKSSMVINCDNPDLPDVTKMSMDDATGVHRLAKKYLDWINRKWGIEYQVLVRMREQADYDPLSVTAREFEEAHGIWANRRADFVRNLKNIRRLTP